MWIHERLVTVDIWDNHDEVCRIVQGAIDDSLTYQQTLSRLGLAYNEFNFCKLLEVIRQLNPKRGQEYTTQFIRDYRAMAVEQMIKGLCSVQPMPNIDWEALAMHPLWQSYVNRHFPSRDNNE